MMARSWKPQIMVDGNWLGNDYRLESEADALAVAETVATRRSDATEWRAVESDEPANCELRGDADPDEGD